MQRRVDAIQSKMRDPAKKFFYNLERDTHRPVDVRCIPGFLTLCCDAATKEQAKLPASELLDTSRWWCAHPVPTVSMDDPKIDSMGFWRGDMWPPTTYLVAYGLARYGYRKEAKLLTNRMVELFRNYGVNERYGGLTGRPLGAPGTK